MGYRSQRGPRRSAGQKFQRSQHEKAKVKTHRPRERAKLPQEETTQTADEIAGKTLNGLKRLGDQKFAVSPFSQYFDDWLVNLKNALYEFETNENIHLDKAFQIERERILDKIQQNLNELKQAEATLSLKVRELSDKNHLLVVTDADYAAKTREIGTRKNKEIQRLTQNVQALETELENMKKKKTGFLSAFDRKTKNKKKETQRMLESAKTDLQSTLHDFQVQQEKLHDEYEKKKQITIEQIQKLEIEVEELENDNSHIPRHEACDALIKAINSLIDKKLASSTDAIP